MHQEPVRVEDLRKLGIHGVTARQVGLLLEQFLRIAREEGLAVKPRSVSEEALQKCILIGFSDRVARRIDEGTPRCELVHGRRGMVARESVVRDSPLLVAAEIQELGGRQGEVNTILSLATAIEAEWLEEFFPNDMQPEQRVVFDSVTRRVRADDILRFRDLVLTSERVEPPPPDAAARLLAEKSLRSGCNWRTGITASRNGSSG
jgi:ATP-dependent helicase HrpB